MAKTLLIILVSLFTTSCRYTYRFGINVKDHPEFFTEEYSKSNNDSTYKGHSRRTIVKHPWIQGENFLVWHMRIAEIGYFRNYPEITDNNYLTTRIYIESSSVVSIKITNSIRGKVLDPISKYYYSYDPVTKELAKVNVDEYPTQHIEPNWSIAEIYEFPEEDLFYTETKKKKWFKDVVQIIEVTYYNETEQKEETIIYRFNVEWYPHMSDLESKLTS